MRTVLGMRSWNLASRGSQLSAKDSSCFIAQCRASSVSTGRSADGRAAYCKSRGQVRGRREWVRQRFGLVDMLLEGSVLRAQQMQAVAREVRAELSAARSGALRPVLASCRTGVWPYEGVVPDVFDGLEEGFC